MEDYIKCELIGGGSPRHLNTFLTCLLLLYTTHISTRAMCCCYTYTHINTCYVLLLYTTRISTHAMYCCYCGLHPYYKVSYSFL